MLIINSGYVPIVMLFPTLNEHFFRILDSYTRAMGRFWDVVWYDFSVGKSIRGKGREKALR